jgi:hypothetical protein
MNDSHKLSPLPRRTAKYITDPQQMSEAVIRGMICNPIYAGVPPYERVVTDEVWIRSAAQLIKEEGAEQFLVNLLYVLRNSMAEVASTEIYATDYNQFQTENDEDLSDEADSTEAPSPWHDPPEGYIFCSHDDAPMIMLEAEFRCVTEFVESHLGDSRITDLISGPVLTLVFQNGHTLPLLCPDCGQSLHIEDKNELLDSLSGMTITAVRWDHELEELALEFGLPGNAYDDIEPLDALFVHLNSVREMTCPHDTTWPETG